jgi:hypothetical protein
MRKDKTKCQDSASGLPGGLSIESFIDSASACVVTQGGNESHVVRVRNRTLLRFGISISSECETASIRYEEDSNKWEDQIEVGHRPDSGGFRERVRSAKLRGSGNVRDESLKVTIQYIAVGCFCEGRADMQLQIDTRE